MSDEDIVLLREEFSLYPGKVKHNVWVTNNHIVVQQIGRGKTEEAIFLDDVIGCHVLHDKKQGDAAYLSVFSYPLKKKMLGSGVVRQRVARTFTINKRKTYQENLLLAETWKMTIKRLVSGEKIMTKEDIENGSLATRNLLVLVNPFSGRKKAINMYMEKVKPMFLEAEIKHTMRKTEYPGHAKEIAKELNLEDWDGVVIVSGDGLVHEVVNGLMDREDWRTAIKMPLGIVPGGSGNALAAAVVYASTGLHGAAKDTTMCVFEICRGCVCPLDLVGLELDEENGLTNSCAEDNAYQQRNLVYSFMGVILGLIADIDIEGESLRCLGGDLRNLIYGIMRIISLRKYSIEVSYLPYSADETSQRLGTMQMEAVNSNPDPIAQGDVASVLPNCKSEDIDPLDYQNRPPPFQDALPSNWVTENDDYVMVLANFMSHLGDVNLCFPESKLDDGQIFLNLSGSNTTRRMLMKAWEQMEDATGVGGGPDFQKPIGKTVRCSAFRIVPKGNRSQIITADGEAIPYGSLQGHILPGIARVMTSKPKCSTDR